MRLYKELPFSLHSQTSSNSFLISVKFSLVVSSWWNRNRVEIKSPEAFRRALLFSFVSIVLLLEYSSLYIYGIETLSEYMNANFTLCSCYTEYTASLFGRCFGAGIMFAYVITLCHDDDIRVVYGSLDVVSRLRDIII